MPRVKPGAHETIEMRSMYNLGIGDHRKISIAKDSGSFLKEAEEQFSWNSHGFEAHAENYHLNTMANVQVTKEELGACFAAGVFLHLAIFRRGEWDAHSFTLLEGTAAVQILMSLFAHELFSESVICSIQHTLLWASSAMAGLYTSILIYRAFFHRLRHFPGPFPARLSQLYMTWLSYRKGQIYEDVRALHRKYGDYVRVGPSEISIADPAAFNAVHSTTSQCERGPWYNILNPTISLQMVRDRKEHARRRKAWDRAFSSKGKYSAGALCCLTAMCATIILDKLCYLGTDTRGPWSLTALRDYEGRVAAYTDELLGVFAREKGRKINVSKWFKYVLLSRLFQPSTNWLRRMYWLLQRR